MYIKKTEKKINYFISGSSLFLYILGSCIPAKASSVEFNVRPNSYSDGYSDSEDSDSSLGYPNHDYYTSIKLSEE